jgi:hypothetical protein
MNNEIKLNIYNKLKLNSNNSDIINFILNNNITHSKNSNGIFLNVSSLSDENLKAIDNILTDFKNMKNNISDINYICLKDYEENKTCEKNIKTYKKLKLNNLETKILSFSF